MQIRGLNVPVYLGGEQSNSSVAFLQEYLDGARTLPEIFEKCPEESREIVGKTIALLFMKGLLANGPEVGPDAIKDCRRSLANGESTYLDRFVGLTGLHRSGIEAANQLGSSSVLVVSDGLAGGICAALLEESGVQNVTSMIYSVKKQTAHQSVSGREPHFDIISEITANLDRNSFELVIAIFTCAPQSLCIELNRLCYDNNTPILFGNAVAEGMDIGPLVVPPNDGCYECLVNRERSINPVAVETELFERHTAATGSEPPFSLNLSTSSFLASSLAMEAVKFLSKISSDLLLKAMIRIPNWSIESRRNRFISVPRCETCGR